MQTQTHYLHGYHVITWTDGFDRSLASLITDCPELILGRRIAIVACDGGPYQPGQAEIAKGWTVHGELAISPGVQSIADLPTPGFDEWYVYENEVTHEQLVASVNHHGFSVLDEQSEQAQVFWSQVRRFQPLHVLGAGAGSMFALSRDEHIHRQLQKLFMTHTDIPDPAAFFLTLGGLHDAKFHANANATDNTLTLTVDDINANLLDMPEYPGKEQAIFIFSDVADVNMDYDVNNNEQGRIYDIEIKDTVNSHKSTLIMAISPGGKLCFDFTSVKYQARSTTR